LLISFLFIVLFFGIWKIIKRLAMIVRELINPESIVIVGGSNDITKPGGRILKNIIEGGYNGQLYAVNPKEDIVQGIKCYSQVAELPKVELAIIAIAAKYTPETVENLINEKGTKGFIILSAGFSEVGEEGTILENNIANIIEKAGGSLIGPNCIGVLTPRYKGSFAGPIPKLDNKGVDFVSGSGATAVFILETAIPMGLTFASLYSVGNSAQIGVEDVLEYWDETFNPETSPKVKMLYLEKVDNPKKFLQHSKSLINKGCRICAIKAGMTDAGSRAASSHTGALAGSDDAVHALFRKAGIVRCYGREQLIYTAGVLAHKELKGKNIAVITHAGGPGVMLTDALSKSGLNVPQLTGEKADELLAQLFHGSAVGNPIDFLATGTAEQLGLILDYVENQFDNIDASVVIFGTPGLFDVKPVYRLLHNKMKTSRKPIYPVLPSTILAREAIEDFLSLGRINFPEEVNLGWAIARVFNTPKPADLNGIPEVNTKAIRTVIDNSVNGYLPPEKVCELLDASGISRVAEAKAITKDDAVPKAKELGYPVVMKVVGPIHKSDIGGVSLFVTDDDSVEKEYDRLMAIPDANSVLIQPMLKGIELFAGATKETDFGHLVLCGLGGIFIEILKDVTKSLTPISKPEAIDMIRNLKSYGLIKGARGQKGVSEEMFADVIVRLSALLEAAPEIAEMDLNPLIGTMEFVTAVDARIRVEK
jgi:acetate---CoA ligase (ADP-forming)